MAQYALYIDVSRNALVAGPTNPSVVSMPPLVQGDTQNLQIYLLSPTGQLSPPYSIINNAGASMQVAIGDKIGNSTNYYASQFVWTADAQNQYFYAAFSLNTAQITTLIGTGASATSTLEVKLINAGMPQTVLEIPVTIQAAVIKDGGAGNVQQGLTPISFEYSEATYLKRLITGAVVFQSPAGKKFAFYIDDDGTIHADPQQ